MRSRILVLVTGVITLVVLTVNSAWSQKLSGQDRGRAEDMLKNVAGEVRKHYYDPKFHGLDWDAKIAETKTKIDGAPSWNVAMSHIAGLFDALNDSHTMFYPPSHVARTEYGFEYQIIGDRAFITQVRPGSDAQAKGVKPGDQLLGLNNFGVNRNTLWRLRYAFNTLRPQMTMSLVLQDQEGNQRKVDAAAKISEGKRQLNLAANGGADLWDLIRQSEGQSHSMRTRYVEYGDALIIVKFPQFDASVDGVEGILGKAKKHQALILDLRGNRGGYVDTLRNLVGGVFDKEIKLYDPVGRQDNKPLMSRSMGNKFNGKLIVLVDSDSASAAEIFARVVQLENRGTVIGDLTSGAVMTARHYSEQMGADAKLFYAASITEADVIMKDGKSLEHVGVTPDEVSLPTPQDMASGRDPVLAHAAELAGVKITPEDAWKAFPYEWPPED